MVGFEERHGYSAVGTVVNLAARLCDEAKDGEVLADKRTVLETAPTMEFESLDPVTLKGFRAPVPAFRLKGRKDAVATLRVVTG